MPTLNPQYLAELATRPVDSPKCPENIHLDIITGHLHAAMLKALKLLENRQTSALGAREVCRVFKAADLNFNRADEFLNFLKTGIGDDPLEAFFMEHPAEADPVPGVTSSTAANIPDNKSQLPQALRLRLVSLNDIIGEHQTAIQSIHGALATAYVVWDELQSGQIKLEQAWQSHIITADDLFAVCSLLPGRADSKEAGDHLAAFLIAHAPGQLEDPATLSAGAQYWIGDYYYSQHDASCPGLL